MFFFSYGGKNKSIGFRPMLTPSHGARPALHPSQQQPSLAPCYRQSFPQLLHSYIKILGQEELHGQPYFSSYKTFNQILRCLVPALGLCPALLLQSRCCSCRALRMEAPSAPCPQSRGWRGRRSRIARLIVHPQSWKSRDKKPPEIWILGSVCGSGPRCSSISRRCHRVSSGSPSRRPRV